MSTPSSAAAPALVPAAGFVAGCALAPHLATAPVAWLAALAAMGVARGRRSGRLLIGLALGLLRAGVEAPSEPRSSGLGLDQPVTAVVRVAGAWSSGEEGYAPSARGRLRAVRQGLLVRGADQEIWIDWSATATPPPLGTVLRVRAMLVRPPGFANRVVVAGGPPRLKVKGALLAEAVAPPGPLDRLVVRVRARFDRVWPSASRRPGIALARAFLVGDTEALSADWRRAFRRSGLAHLLAVSGFNVGLIAVAALLATAPLPRPVRLAVTALMVAAYAATVGPLAPILRAAEMAMLAILALAWKRPPSAAHALGLVACAALTIEPGAVGELSFQLTFAATAALVIVAPALARRWSALPMRAAIALAAAVAAQWATLPWAFLHFHHAQLLAVAYNLVALPWAAATMLLAAAATAVAIAVPATTPALWWVMDLAAKPIDWLAAPGFHLGVVAVAPPRSAAAAILALLAAALWWPRRVGIPVLALVATILVWSTRKADSRELPASSASWTALDVGQGDATLLRGGGVAVLVDGGGQGRGDFAGRVLVPALAAEGVRRIDVAVVSHPDRDHCEGLAGVADYLPIGEVWAAPGWERSPCARRLVAEIGARAAVLVAGDRRRRGNWTFEVLSPTLGSAPGSDNDASLVLRASAAGRSVLLPGDLEERGERALVARTGAGLRADWLKLAHHGSKTSSSADFLRAVAPRLAWASVGRDNAFGHPAPLVSERLERLGVRLLRTDRSGLIHVSWDRDGRQRLETAGQSLAGSRR
jgi:competence protein ComEC